ncbi:MAG TPA: hypothetical protein VK003_16025 [Oceanobacillus sp.]|nr:hypothetical protein [Oceanobacillus sp.]
MLQVTVKDNRLHFGDGFSIVFERTLRIPDDGKTYPLPPGLGAFPILKVADFADKLPEDWRKHGGVFIPMYQREAMWMRFNARYWKPNAVKIAVGKVNAVSGKPWNQALKKEKQDYLVCPPQPWLDGINAGDDTIRQFVAMPLGMGYTVEAQVTGKEEYGGVQIIVYEPKQGKFPDEPPYQEERFFRMAAAAPASPMATKLVAGAAMGLGAGGKMRQKIYPDLHGIDTWDQENYGRVYVHIVNSMMFREITGKEPPPTPITAKTYAQYKFPWFDLYDDHMGDVEAPEALQNVKSVKEMDEQKGFQTQQDDSPVNVPDDLIIKYKVKTDDVQDGEW